MTAELRELGPGETGLAFEAMRSLRTHLTDRDAFVRRVDEVQRPQGYRLVGAFPEGAAEAGAVTGFRVIEWLATGRMLYVDDLATAPAARRQGLAGRLVDWLVEEGRRLDCDDVQLDSRAHPERWDAHRLYLNHGFAITSFHFWRDLRA